MNTTTTKSPTTLLLQAATLFGSGITAGFTFYITKIELPSRKDKPIEYQLDNYHQVFPLAAAFMKPFGMLLTVVTAATLYVTKKQLLWIPLVSIGALGPFTAICIQPTNEKLMGTPNKDAAKVKEDVQKWGRLHNVRTVMAMIGFAGAVASAVLDM